MPDTLREGCAPSECGTKAACASCSSRPKSVSDLKSQHPNIKKVIGVVSGKGGVGKSSVSAQLAVLLKRMGYNVAVMDADITGPSIPHMFGIHEKAFGDGTHIFPAESETGIKMMSINLLLESEDVPVIWRGPVIAGVVNQFWDDVAWENTDCMVIDMPPGTGDVPLTIFQTVPLDGIIIVTTPQDLVGMIVRKAVHMASEMNIPVLGLIENMSYVVCPDCGKHIEVFGASNAAKLSSDLSIPLLAQLPFDPSTASLCDQGTIEKMTSTALQDTASYLAGALNL